MAALFGAGHRAVTTRVAKRGKGKARSSETRPKTLIGATKGTFKIVGDIVGPIVEWDEERSLQRLADLIEGRTPRGPKRSTRPRKDAKAKSRHSKP
jgi:hypothetical protein